MATANTYLPPCPVIQPFLIVTNITRSNPCVVTVEEENSYIAGQLVRFSVPESYQMEINGLTGEILSTNGLQMVVAINTRAFNSFVIPEGNKQVQPATISPAGSRNIYNFTTVPFHSAGNFGN